MLILDCNGLCHMAKHAMGELSFEGVETGVLFGFFYQLRKLYETLGPQKTVFVWDSVSSIRKKKYPWYKKKRHDRPKNPVEKEYDTICYKQFNALKNRWIPFLGFNNNFFQKGYEADDVIASIVLNKKRKKKPIVVTSDNDLLQLLDACDIFNPHKKKIFTAKDFRKKYMLEPRDWGEVKAIAGCSTDEVPGIEGVGEGRAAQIIRGDLYKGKFYDRYKEGFETIVTRNREIVVLPLHGVKVFKIKKDRVDFKQFITMCQQLGFYSFLKSKKELDRWRAVLSLV